MVGGAPPHPIDDAAAPVAAPPPVTALAVAAPPPEVAPPSDQSGVPAVSAPLPIPVDDTDAMKVRLWQGVRVGIISY